MTGNEVHNNSIDITTYPHERLHIINIKFDIHLLRIFTNKYQKQISIKKLANTIRNAETKCRIYTSTLNNNSTIKKN